MLVIKIIVSKYSLFADPMLLVMDFAPMGNLLNFLRANRHVTPHQMMSSSHVTLTNRHQVVFALHVANGMAYISSKEVHKLFIFSKYHTINTNSKNILKLNTKQLVTTTAVL